MRTNATTAIDDLTYNYTGNQLQSVTDGVTSYSFEGFKDGNTTGNDYSYDANGNMIKDNNKDILNIEYNHLNLPTFVQMASGNITYIYDAAGVKQLKQVTSSGFSPNITTTSYAGNYIYKEDYNGESLQFFNHPEGYVEPENGGFNYVYQYKDHLGNIRLSYSDTNNDGQIQADSEIIQEKNYYPFGLKHKGYNNVINGTHHPYGYNGKEENDEIGLQWLDFGARNYDAALGRWMNLDPLAELMRRHSPYNYAFNNPVYFIDPDGMMAGPGDLYATEEAAAENFAQEYNGMSITYGLEIKASIYSTTNDEGVTSYSYTTPDSAGAGLAGENDTSSAPEDAVFTADIHTHGGDEDVYTQDGKDKSDANQVSDPDINVYRNRKNEDGEGNQYGKKVNGYVVTPNGGLLKYDPNKEYGRQSDDNKDYNKPISTAGIPSDPASKSLRLNKVSPSRMPAVLPANFDTKDHKKRKGYE